MKKLFTSVFFVIMTFCLTACTVPGASGGSSVHNGLDCAFISDVSFDLDKLDAEGVIKRFGSGMWSVEFSSPNTLSGIKLEFSEGNVSASYKGLNFSVPQSALPVKAMMLNLIKAVDDNAAQEKLIGSESENGFTVNGTLEGGDYTITVNESGQINCFEMPNNKLKITFRELKTITSSEAETEPAELPSEPQQPTE